MPVPQMIQRLREEQAQTQGNGLVKSGVFHILSTNALSPLMKVGRKFQGIALKEQPQHEALLRFNANKIGITDIPKNRLLPTLAKQ